MQAEAVDRKTYNQLKEMMGEDFITELVDTYLDDSPQQISSLRESLTRGDAETFRRSAHSLKSNSASIGALTLSGMARELEMLGKSGSLGGAGPLVEQLANEYDQVRSLLVGWRHES